MIRVFVPGIAVPQGSMRGFVRGGRAILTSANPALRSWRADVTNALLAVRVAALEGPVSLRLDFVMVRPLGHFGRRGLLPSAPVYPARKPDLDKLVRGICDSATVAGVWHDDAQVVTIRATKRYVCDDTTPGVWIGVEAMDVAGPALRDAELPGADLR